MYGNSLSQALLVVMLVGLISLFIINVTLLRVAKFLKVGVQMPPRTALGMAFILLIGFAISQILQFPILNFIDNFAPYYSGLVRHIIFILVYSAVIWFSAKKFRSLKVKNYRSALIISTIIELSHQLVPPLLHALVG